MRTTIDRAGRVVIPKRCRDEIGMLAGDVEITIDGAALRIEPVANDELADRAGRPIVPGAGGHIDDEAVRALRYADQR